MVVMEIGQTLFNATPLPCLHTLRDFTSSTHIYTRSHTHTHTYTHAVKTNDNLDRFLQAQSFKSDFSGQLPATLHCYLSSGGVEEAEPPSFSFCKAIMMSVNLSILADSMEILTSTSVGGSTSSAFMISALGSDIRE